MEGRRAAVQREAQGGARTGGWRRGLQETRGSEGRARLGPQDLLFVGFERCPVEGLAARGGGGIGRSRVEASGSI